RNNAGAQKDNHYIAITLKQAGKNTFAVGGSIKIFSGDAIYTREVIPSRGFQSSVDYKNVIGLGNSKPDSMMVVWPDRSYSTYYNPAVDTTYMITKPAHTQKIL